MTKTYNATGINLKSMPLGEADRLVTILTPEWGLIRVVAPGSRKQNSKLAGRMGLFVVNELLIYKGRSLDKITQAETLESYPGLAKDLGKLAASQYLAELVLCHALSEQPQAELYALFNEHLRRLEQLPPLSSSPTGSSLILAHLCHGIFHLLALAGIAPQVQQCCITQHPIQPDVTDPNWQVGFSVEAGGTYRLAVEVSQPENLFHPLVSRNHGISQSPLPRLTCKLSAVELTIVQQLAAAELTPASLDAIAPLWVKVERMLRDYAQYHFGRSIRSAGLLNALTMSAEL
ncbi:MAG: DNA repair protein RecO [Coleofasciculus sp. G1-WW12-02]|uniref:DNA repair protein RecO n=1 Tax=Coleofasciculus sp. G1-WW12-02 TaxID=3068483 RepID=UPI0032F42F2C